MGRKILALVENTIGTTLLLSTRFQALGYQAIILSSPVAFRKRIEADTFDWIILDAAAMPLFQRRFVTQIDRLRKQARIVWCGKPVLQSSLPIEAIFEKPLRYDEIQRFFSARSSPELHAASSPKGGPAGDPESKPRMPSRFTERGDQEIPGKGASADGTGEGDGEP